MHLLNGVLCSCDISCFLNLYSTAFYAYFNDRLLLGLYGTHAAAVQMTQNVQCVPRRPLPTSAERSLFLLLSWPDPLFTSVILTRISRLQDHPLAFSCFIFIVTEAVRAKAEDMNPHKCKPSCPCWSPTGLCSWANVEMGCSVAELLHHV